MISRASEYAIRALTYLAQNEGEEGYFLARDMAEKLGVPAPFLSKILQPLVASGMILSQRGRKGGFRLAAGRSRESITLFEVVDSQEHLNKVRKCFLGQAECTDERACPMHVYWQSTSTDYIDVLRRTTLADMFDFCATSVESNYPFPLPARK